MQRKNEAPSPKAQFFDAIFVSDDVLQSCGVIIDGIIIICLHSAWSIFYYMQKKCGSGYSCGSGEGC